MIRHQRNGLGSLAVSASLVGDAHQPALRIPAIVALPVREQIAVRVVAQRLPGQIRQLVEVVVPAVWLVTEG
jgi:hypothetical protein